MLALAWLRADESIARRARARWRRSASGSTIQPAFHKAFVGAAGTLVEIDTGADLHYNPTGIVRIHHAGGSAGDVLGRRDGRSATTRFRRSRRARSRSGRRGRTSTGTGTRWPSTAATTCSRRRSASWPRSRDRVEAELIYRGALRGGATAVRERVVVGARRGPSSNTRLTGEVRAVRQTYPLLVTDGVQPTAIAVNGRRVERVARRRADGLRGARRWSAASAFRRVGARAATAFMDAAYADAQGRTMPLPGDVHGESNMKPFLDDNFLLDSDVAEDLYHRYAKDLPIIDYHCHLLAGPDRERPSLPVDHRDLAGRRPLQVAGDADRTACRSGTAPATRRTGRSSRRGRARCRTPCGIRSTTGRTWSCAARSASPTLLSPATARDDLRPVQRAAAGGRLHDARPAARFQGGGRLHDRRPGRFARRPSPAGRSVRPGDAGLSDVAARPRVRRGRSRTRSTRGWRASRRRPDVAIGGSARRVPRGARGAAHVLPRRWGAAPPTTASRRCCRAVVRRRTSARRSTACGRGRRSTPAPRAGSVSALLHRLALLDHARGWVQQFHLGALRNNNTRLRRTLGPDTGFDSIGDFEIARPLSRFLDRLDQTESAREDDPVQPESPRQRAARDDDRELPGRERAGEDAVRFGLVVPGSARRDDRPDGHPVEHGPAVAVRRHGHRFALVPLVLAARVLPAPALQPARRGRAAGPAAGRPRRCSARSWRASASSTRATTSASRWARRRTARADPARATA